MSDDSDDEEEVSDDTHKKQVVVESDKAMLMLMGLLENAGNEGAFSGPAYQLLVVMALQDEGVSANKPNARLTYGRMSKLTLMKDGTTHLGTPKNSSLFAWMGKYKDAVIYMSTCCLIRVKYKFIMRQILCKTECRLFIKAAVKGLKEEGAFIKGHPKARGPKPKSKSTKRKRREPEEEATAQPVQKRRKLNKKGDIDEDSLVDNDEDSDADDEMATAEESDELNLEAMEEELQDMEDKELEDKDLVILEGTHRPQCAALREHFSQHGMSNCHLQCCEIVDLVMNQ